jgi:hypothetical protein
MGRPQDDWAAQLADEELDSLGEGARRELLDLGGDAEEEV